MILAKANPSRNQILIIEDDAMQAGILATGLSGAGFEVDAASAGLEAIQKIEMKVYDAVLFVTTSPRSTASLSPELSEMFSEQWPGLS